MTIISTIILIVHIQPISYLAELASKDVLSYSELRGLRTRLIFDAGAALLVLLVAVALSVYKPWGKTPYGLRNPNKASDVVKIKKPWGLCILTGLILLVVLLFIVSHLIGGRIGHH